MVDRIISLLRVLKCVWSPEFSMLKEWAFLTCLIFIFHVFLKYLFIFYWLGIQIIPTYATNSRLWNCGAEFSLLLLLYLIIILIINFNFIYYHRYILYRDLLTRRYNNSYTDYQYCIVFQINNLLYKNSF